jgi:large subunit ribosomal protein L22
MEKAQVYAKQKYARISAKKVVPVLNLVRGKSASEAVRILKFDKTKAAKLSLKVLQSAIANAKETKNLDEAKLFVADARAEEGNVLKRGRVSGRSRYSRILKRMAHIVIGLSEKEIK